ncbi:MAG: OmpA family protein [Deltaproteobacteria bacterium]|jgi:OOP family OmpA-OmpF porin|nr:OmpA family protein [Deltaproteobacteria bacterium]
MKIKLAILAFVALALCLPGPAAAQMSGETVHLTLSGGYLFPNNKIAVEDGPVFGLGIGYNFTKNWGLEAFGYFSPNLDDDDYLPGFNLDNYGPRVYDNDVTMLRLSAIHHFDLGGNFTPYVSLGVGGQFINRDQPRYENYRSFAANAGIGFKYFFNEVVALRVEANDAYGFSKKQGAKFNAPMITAGLTFQIGAGPSACADEDSDGVCDAYDKCPGPPAGYKVDADGCPITRTIRLEVKFDFDKSIVKPEYDPEIKKAADFLCDHPGTTAVIEGHTDSIGADDYNLKLSQRRADAIRQELIDKFGLSPSVIEAVGHGESNPIADNSTAAGRAENRRVLGVFSGTDVTD